MKYCRRQDICRLHIKKSHYNGREEGHRGIEVPIEQKSGEMHDGKHDTDNNNAFKVVTHDILHKSPEENLLRKRYRKQLHQYCIKGQGGECLTGGKDKIKRDKRQK